MWLLLPHPLPCLMRALPALSALCEQHQHVMRMVVSVWRRSFHDGLAVVGTQLVVLDFKFASLHDLRSHKLLSPLALSAPPRVPTMVVASARDRLLPSLSEAGRLVSLIPGALRVVLPDSGHTALLESKVRAAWYG